MGRATTLSQKPLGPAGRVEVVTIGPSQPSTDRPVSMSAGAARKSTAPTNLQLVDVASGMFGGTTGTLSWSLPTTGPPLAHRVLRDGVEIARVPGTQTSVEVPDLARGLVSTFVVVAVDGASGAESKPLIAGIARDPNSGITLKAVPTASNGSSAQLSWNTPAASDTVTLYKLLVNGQVVATLPPSGIAMNGFEAKSLPSGAVAEVVAVFASGATLSSTPVPISAGGGGSGFGVAIGAARKSTAPTNLQLVDVASGMFGGTTGTLSWSLPTTGPPLAHRVLRDGVEIARVPGTQTSVEVPDLARGLVSTFVVVAVDGASGAESKPLIAGIARDPNSGITLKAVPTASNGSSAQLSWNTPAASDTVTLYKLLVNGQVVATLPPSGIAMNGFEAKSLPSGAVAEVVAVFASGATLSSTPVPISAGGGGSGFGVRAARKSTAPTNLQLVDVASGMFGGTTGTLSWSLPTTGPPLAHRVLRDGVEIARVPGTQTSVEVPDLARGLVSTFVVVAVDGASGAESKPLIAGIARDPNSGITLKAVPTASNGSSAQLSWNTPAASDTVTLYKLLVNGQVVATLPPSGIAMNGFEAKSLPSGAVAEVVAVFASGATLSSTPVPISAGGGGSGFGVGAARKSTAPTNLQLVDVASGMFGGTTGTLSWSLPTTGPPLAHRVLRDGVEIARVPGTQTSVEVPDLARGLVSTFVVVAVDGASGAESKPLIAGIARDPNSGITLKAVPTASNGSSAQLSWNTPAASDTVTLYKLLVNGQVVATLPPSGIAMNGFEAKSLPSGAVAEVVAVFASGATLSSTPVPISAGGGGSGFGVAIGAARKSTAPTNLQLVDVASGMFGGTTGTLSWSLPTTGPPLAHRVLRDGVEIARVPGTQTSVEVPDLARGLVSTFVVVAVDGASGAESKPLIAGIARDPNSGITLKAVPTASNGSSAQLSWNTPAASDTVTLYKLLVNGQVVATLPPSGIAMNGFEAKSLPSGAVAEVVAVFASGATLSSTPVPISAGGGGSGFGVGAARKSTAPTNLQLVDVASGMFGGTTGTLSWSLPTTGPPLAHRVLRDGVEIARVPGTQTSVEVPDLARGLVSTFVVVAVDGASGAESKPLIAGIARDPNSGITLKAVPTASNGSSAQLSWNTPAASDTVTLYKLLVNGQVVATLPPSGIAMNGFEAKSLPSGAVAEVVAVFASGATLSSTPVPISAGGGGSGFGVGAARKSTAPTNLQLVDVASGMFGGTTGTLSWSLPTTGPPLAHRVLRDGVEIARVPGTQTSVEVPDLARGLVSTFVVVAVDGASGAESKPLIAGIARDPNSGITLKAVPTASNGSSAQLSWNTPAASDTVTLYKLLVNGQVVATLPPSGIAMNGFEAKSLPSGAVAEVVAVFASGATLSSTPVPISAGGGGSGFGVAIGAARKSTAPTNLQLVDVASGMFGGTTGTLSWSLPTTGPPLAHRVLRDGVEIARVPGTQTSVEVPDLARGLVSTFVVVAVDGASGAESKPLIAGIARDPNSGITLKAVPTASNGSSAQLSWNTPAASDTVTLYKLLVNGQVVATLPPSGIAMNGFEAKSLPSGAVAEVVAVFASGATLSSTPVPISAGGGGSGFGVGAARKSTAPTNLQLVDVASGMFGGTTGTLSWSLPTTGPPLAHRVLRDGVEIARVPGTQTSVEVPDLARGLVSTFVVVAVDGASGAESKPLIAGIARDPNSGITLKAVPTASNGSSAQLSWNTPAASDTVTLYKLLVNGQVVATLPPSGIAMNGFEAKSLPSGAVAEVVAVFASGATLSSTPVPISAGGGGSGFGVGAARKSTAPTNLQLVDVASGMFGGTTGTLSWSLPTTGPPLAHRVLRDGVEIARVPGTQTSVEVPDLARGLVSTFVVVAVDGASGAESKPLIAGIARDPNSGITLKAVPTASNGSSAQLSWNTPAASDTVTLYKLLVNGQVVATLPPSGIAMNGFEAKSLPSGAVAEVVAVFASGATLSSTPVPISAGGGGSGFGVAIGAARKSTAPTNLQLVDVASGMFGGTTGTLSWSLPTTGPPLAHRVLRDGVEIARVPGTQTSVEVPDLARGLVSTFVVVAVDGASGAESKPLIAGIARDPNSGITLKAVPTASNGSSAQLSWNTPAASDTVTLYKLLVNGQVVATLPPSGIAMNGFEAKSLPSGAVAEVVAVFASGATLSSTPVPISAGGGGSGFGVGAARKSTAPTNLQLVDVASGMFGGTTGTLSWSLPTTGPPLAHRVLRDGVEIARVPGTQTSVEVPDLARGLVSTFVVVAVDGASGAESKPLIAGIARDPNSGITLKAVPTASNGSSAQLSWNTPAASDTVTLYKLLVNGQVVATLPPSGIAMNGFEAKSLPSGAVAEVVAVFASGATLSSTPVPISAGGGGSGFGVGAARKSTAPTNLQLVDVASGMFGGTTGTLSWSLPTTGPPLAHRVLRDGVEIARVPGTQTSVEVPDLARGLVSTFVVVAVDGASGAESKPLIAGIARDPNSGITLKAVPTASNGSSAQLSWNTPAASDTVTLYKLLVNGQVVATLPPSGIAMNGFEAKSLPSGAVAEVVAVFASGAMLSSTPLVDVASGMFGGTTGTLSWSLPTTGPPLAHRVLRDGVEIARVPGTQTSVEVPDLARGLVSTFVVVAVDGASGAESKPLIAGIARDPNSGITLKAVPTASNGSSAQLSWNTPAASDTVTLYKLLVNGQVVATLPPSGIAMNGFEAKSLPSGAVAEVVAVFASGATLSSTPVPISAGGGGSGFGVRAARKSTAPTNLQLVDVASGMFGGTTGTLSWSLPTTGPPLAHRVLRDGVEIARVPGTQTSVEPLIAGIARDPNSGITLKAVPTASNGSSAQLSWNTPAASDTVTLYKLLVNGQVVATLPPSGIAMNGFEAKSLPSVPVAASRVVELQPYDSKARSDKGEEEAPSVAAPGDLELELNKVAQDRHDPKRASCVLTWKAPGSS
eukprot:tig00000022_g4805.t1